MAPNSAAPTDIPIMRMNICDPVATPRSRHETVPWIATMNVVLQNPIPLPISSEPATGHATADARSSVRRTALPAISEAAPIAKVSRYDA